HTMGKSADATRIRDEVRRGGVVLKQAAHLPGRVLRPVRIVVVLRPARQTVTALKPATPVGRRTHGDPDRAGPLLRETVCTVAALPRVLIVVVRVVPARMIVIGTVRVSQRARRAQRETRRGRRRDP